jgi:hypothetical protein
LEKPIELSLAAKIAFELYGDPLEKVVEIAGIIEGHKND